MKIEVGKYTLYSDSLCMWLTEKYVKEKGKHIGETEERRVAGYSTSLTNLLRSFRDKKVGGSDAESLEELIEALRNVYDDMERLYRCGVEEGLQKLKGMSKR